MDERPMDEQAVIEAQIGRPLRADSTVVSRCHLDLPVVVQVPPILDDGTPFPTLFWLSCPLASKRVGRMEGVGGVKAMERRADGNPEFDERLTAAHERYAQQREALLSYDAHPRPSGGVGGTTVGVKCLHAHYADTRSGNDNPVGELVAPWVEPLDCDRACVAEVDGIVQANPRWTEPR
jgi:hypothetical protein